ncbi:MAG: glycerol-3-phosphate acyltransferase [Chloroflexota bacterium]
MSFPLILVYAIGLGSIGYLSGSIPFAIWVTKFFKGMDVRLAGSGHASTTNTFRQAGFGPGVIVFIFDTAKGFLPTWLALHFAPAAWIIPLTAGLAVAGHCWPVFAGFRGGMGLATTGGALLAVQPLGFIIALGVLISLTLIIRHSARAAVFTGIMMAPVLWLVGLRGLVFTTAIVTGIVIAYRFTVDWNRKYREHWLDREN